MTLAFRWGAMTSLIALVIMSIIGLIEVILGREIGWNSWLPFAAGAIAMLPMLLSDLGFRRWLIMESFKQTSRSEAREMRGLAGDRFLIVLDLAKFALFASIIGILLSAALGIFGFIPVRFLGQSGQILLALLTTALFASTAVYFAVRWRWPLQHDEFLMARVPRLDLILVDPSRAPRISVDGKEVASADPSATRNSAVPWRALAAILGTVAALTLVGFVADRAIPQLGGAVSGALSPILQTGAILAPLTWGVWAILRQRRQP